MNAIKDQNGRPVGIAVSKLDGETILPIVGKSNALIVDNGTMGANYSRRNAAIDENSVSTMTALSSTGDGSIVNLYICPLTKTLLTKSN